MVWFLMAKTPEVSMRSQLVLPALSLGCVLEQAAGPS